MIEKNSEHEKELEIIRRLIKNVYKLDMPILITLGLGVLSQFFIPVITPIFGVLAFFIFYKKLQNAAHYPCPRCLEPFGSSTKIVAVISVASISSSSASEVFGFASHNNSTRLNASL
jgi:hypothetical protein